MVKITARGFNLVDVTKDIVNKELKKVKKALPKVANFDVTISKEINGYSCDIIVKDAGSFIKSEGKAESAEASVSSAVGALKRKVRKLKDYFVDKKRRRTAGGVAAEFVNPFEDEVESSAKNLIVKTKKVPLQMMDADEAIAQMEMLDYTYFIYISEDGTVRLIYRSDKGYCMLICD